MNNTAATARPGEPVIEQILTDIAGLDYDIASLLFVMQAKVQRDPKVMSAMGPAKQRAAAARVAGGSWASEALTQVHEAAMRRVDEVYPDWRDHAAQAPNVSFGDAPSVIADIATGAAFVALEGASLSHEEVTMLARLWNELVAKDHPVVPPRRPRTGLLAKLFGPG